MSGGTRSYEMARRLVAMGHEVNMVTSWREEDGRHSCFTTDEAGIKVHWLPVPYANQMSYNQRIRAFFKFAWDAARKAASLPADVVFATSTPLTIALPGIYAARRQNVPMVFEVRDLWPEMPIVIGALRGRLAIGCARALERWAYRHSKAVVALSPGMKEGVVRAGYDARRVTVIPNGCDLDEFRCDSAAAHAFRASRPWMGERPLLVYAGSLGKLNGAGYAVELAVELKQRGSDVAVLLVGRGAEGELISQRAQAAGVLDDNFFMEDELLKTEMPALFAAATMAASLFIDLPEMRVNSANKFFDALAAGKPVFLNYGGWMHDLVNQHGCGLAMWRQQLKVVAGELDRVLHDAGWLERAGQAARRLAEQQFARDELAARLERVLVDAMERRGDT
jgi:glycosyltransferase involved in cell wall biosynthesis